MEKDYEKDNDTLAFSCDEVRLNLSERVIFPTNLEYRLRWLSHSFRESKVIENAARSADISQEVEI